MASNDDMTLAVHEPRSRHYVTDGRGHSRFYSAVLGRVENHGKVAQEHKSHQPLKVVLKIKKSRLITRKIRYIALKFILHLHFIYSLDKDEHGCKSADNKATSNCFQTFKIKEA